VEVTVNPVHLEGLDLQEEVEHQDRQGQRVQQEVLVLPDCLEQVELPVCRVPQVPQGYRDQRGLLAAQVLLELPEFLVRLEARVRQARSVRRALPEVPEGPEPLDPRDQVDRTERTELLGVLVQRVSRAVKDHPDPPELQVLWDLRDQQDLREVMDYLEQPERQGLPDQEEVPVMPESLVRPDCPDLEELRVWQALPGHRVLQVLLAQRDRLDQLEGQVLQARQVLWECRVYRERMVLRVCRVLPGPRVRLEHRAPRALPDQLVYPGDKAPRDLRDPRDHLEVLARWVELDHRAHRGGRDHLGGQVVLEPRVR